LGLVGGNAILDQVRVANGKLDQLLHRVAANQTQSAVNALTLAHLSQAVGGLPSAGAREVWQFDITSIQAGAGVPAGIALNYVDNWTHYSTARQWQTIADNALWLYAFDPFYLIGSFQPAVPVRDLGTRNPGERVIDWCRRMRPDLTWWYGGQNDGPPFTNYTYGYVTTYDADQSVYFTCTLTEWDAFLIDQQRAGLITTAPVWPGLANVNLGTPVPITPIEQTITGPMHGVVITITDGFQRLPHYKLGGVDSYKALGTITFTDDHGDAETFQLLGPVHGVYCPSRMVEAQTLECRWLPGLAGSVTPWTRK